LGFKFQRVLTFKKCGKWQCWISKAKTHELYSKIVNLNPDVEVLIPAAGQGLRLGAGIPKSLVAVRGRPIIEWQLKSLRSFEGQITVIVGYQVDEVVDFVSSLYSWVQFIYKADHKTTGTASSLLLAAKCVNTVSILAIAGETDLATVNPETATHGIQRRTKIK
jgi:bifunctional N-acetylglucosamine-1-phosphate-uridyltransferase/glucosamine-1-phosphate-acetyltransferase GlmU-like protein